MQMSSSGHIVFKINVSWNKYFRENILLDFPSSNDKQLRYMKDADWDTLDFLLQILPLISPEHDLLPLGGKSVYGDWINTELEREYNHSVAPNPICMSSHR